MLLNISHIDTNKCMYIKLYTTENIVTYYWLCFDVRLTSKCSQ